MNVLIVAATTMEMKPTLEYLEMHGTRINFFTYRLTEKIIIHTLVTGVGALQTAFALSRFSAMKEIDLAINIGIAGSYNRDLPLTSVVCIERDRFADLGAEDNDGSFIDLFDMNLSDANQWPFNEGWIYANKSTLYTTNLPKVTAITINTTTGTQQSKDKLTHKYSPDIESMEGAGFFYACGVLDVPSIQMRSISNYVEPRNKASWKIPESIQSVHETLMKFLLSI